MLGDDPINLGILAEISFRTVFDVEQKGYAAWWAPVAGVVLTIGCGLFALGRRWLYLKVLRNIPLLLAGFCAVWTVSVFFLTYFRHASLSAALREGRCEITEGEVSHFHPMPAGGRRGDGIFKQ